MISSSRKANLQTVSRVLPGVPTWGCHLGSLVLLFPPSVHTWCLAIPSIALFILNPVSLPMQTGKQSNPKMASKLSLYDPHWLSDLTFSGASNSIPSSHTCSLLFPDFATPIPIWGDLYTTFSLPGTDSPRRLLG